MRTADHDNEDLVVRGTLATPPPLTITPPAHEPIVMDVGDELTQLGVILHGATRFAHRILGVVRAASELQVLVMNAEADPVACSERSTKLRDLAETLVSDAAELSPSLTRAARICLDLHAMTGEGVVPGKVG